MTIDVLIFGGAALAAKADRVSVKLGDRSTPPTVREVALAMAAQHPALAFALSIPRLAVNHAFATPETPVNTGDEVALITLVGGG